MIARIPVAILLRRRGNLKYLVLWSGPLEETVRYFTLTLVGKNFESAMRVGTGWASAEILYLLIGFEISRRWGRRDEGQISVPTRLRKWAPLLAFWERLSAFLFHLGASGLIAFAPAATPLVAVEHTGINLAVLKLRRNVLAAELVGFLLSMATVGLAVLLWHRLPYRTYGLRT